MSNGLTTDQEAAALAPHRKNVPLVEILFNSGALRLAMAPYPTVVGSDTYIATGALLEIDAIPEASDSQEGLTLTLSGLDAAIVALATSEPYRGRVITIRKARMRDDDSGVPSMIDTPTIEWIGRLRDMSLQQTNQTFQVVVQAEHFEIELTRASPRRWSDSDQQRDYPGDKACEWAAVMTEKQLVFPSKEALQE